MKHTKLAKVFLMLSATAASALASEQELEALSPLAANITGNGLIDEINPNELKLSQILAEEDAIDTEGGLLVMPENAKIHQRRELSGDEDEHAGEDHDDEHAGEDHDDKHEGEGHSDHEGEHHSDDHEKEGAAVAGAEGHSDHEGEGHSDHEGEGHSDHEGEGHSDHEGEAGHSDHEDDGINIDTFKIIMLFAMILCVGLGIIPKLWGKCRDNEEILSMLNCFSAGIFMGMSLVHMMPEAAEVYQTWAICEQIEKPFPLPYVMYFMGYFLILSIDRVAARAYHQGHDHNQGKPGQQNISVDMIRSNEDKPQAIEMASGRSNQVEAMSPKANAMDAGERGIPVPKADVTPAAAADASSKAAGVSVSKTAAIILVLALGAHAFFEGIAFGLQTSIESAGQLAAGILIHKSAAAVSLGGAFANTGYTLKEIILFLTIFSIIAPIGIIIGMSISNSDKIIDVVFLSLSGGTFIYVACSEIIVAEFEKGNKQWLKMILVFVGGLIITLLWFFDEHSHEAGCDGAVDAHAGHPGH